MFKKIAAILLLVGVMTPYSCDVRPISTLRGDWPGVLAAGVPVLCIIFYALQALVPRLPEVLRGARKALQPLLVAILLVVAGTWIAGVFSEENEPWPTFALLGASFIWSGWLAVRALRRAGAANPLPLLLLAIIGIPAVNYFAWEWSDSHLKYGAWILSAGYVLAAVEELREG